MNPRSTAGSPIPSHGVQKVRSMKSGEPWTGTNGAVKGNSLLRFFLAR
jgi:hypothetical protein